MRKRPVNRAKSADVRPRLESAEALHVLTLSQIAGSTLSKQQLLAALTQPRSASRSRPGCGDLAPSLGLGSGAERIGG